VKRGTNVSARSTIATSSETSAIAAWGDGSRPFSVNPNSTSLDRVSVNATRVPTATAMPAARTGHSWRTTSRPATTADTTALATKLRPRFASGKLR
jgi:hypothetical protein